MKKVIEIIGIIVALNIFINYLAPNGLFWIVVIIGLIVYLVRKSKSDKTNDDEQKIITKSNNAPENDYSKFNKSLHELSFDKNQYVIKQTVTEPVKQDYSEFIDAVKSEEYKLPSLNLFEKTPSPTRGEISNVKSQGEYICEYFNNNGIECDFTGGAISESFISIKLTLKKKKYLNEYLDYLDMLKSKLEYKDIYSYDVIEGDEYNVYILLGDREKLKFGTLITKENLDNKLSYVIGEDYEGNAIFGNLKENGNLLIAGDQMTGKTSLATLILISLLTKNIPTELKLIIADSKLLNYAQFSKLEHLIYPILSDRSNNIFDCLQTLRKIYLARIKLLNENKFKSIEDYNNNSEKKLYPVVFFIDELDGYAYRFGKEFTTALYKVISHGPRVGIYCIATVHDIHKEVLSDPLREIFDGRISFAMVNGSQLKIALNIEKAESRIQSGEVIYKENTKARCKRVLTPLLTEEDISVVCKKYRKSFDSSINLDNQMEVESSCSEKQSN